MTRDWEREAQEHEAAADRLERDAKARRWAAEICRKTGEYERKSEGMAREFPKVLGEFAQ